MGVSTASGVYCETSMPRKLTPFPSLANPSLSLSPPLLPFLANLLSKHKIRIPLMFDSMPSYACPVRLTGIKFSKPSDCSSLRGRILDIWNGGIIVEREEKKEEEGKKKERDKIRICKNRKKSIGSSLSGRVYFALMEEAFASSCEAPINSKIADNR